MTKALEILKNGIILMEESIKPNPATREYIDNEIKLYKEAIEELEQYEEEKNQNCNNCDDYKDGICTDHKRHYCSASLYMENRWTPKVKDN